MAQAGTPLTISYPILLSGVELNFATHKEPGNEIALTQSSCRSGRHDILLAVTIWVFKNIESFFSTQSKVWWSMQGICCALQSDIRSCLQIRLSRADLRWSKDCSAERRFLHDARFWGKSHVFCVAMKCFLLLSNLIFDWANRDRLI